MSPNLPPLRHKHFDILLPRGSYLSDKLERAIETGSYERWEGSFVRQLLSGGERVLELGGGMGFVSTLACQSSRPALYHLIEANPQMIPVIHETHRLNGVTGVTVDNCILTNTPADLARGSVTFAVAHNFTASSAMKLGIGRPEIEVPARSFNEAMAQHRYDTLICDIEGSELELIRSADLSSLRRIMLEIHTGIIGLAAIHEIFGLLSAAGFAYDEKLSHGSVVTFCRL